MSSKPITLEDCDANIAEWYDRLKNDPTARASECRKKINWWLDLRIALQEPKSHSMDLAA